MSTTIKDDGKHLQLAVAVVGNVTEGFSFYGPFPDFDAAAAWADAAGLSTINSWIATLEDPNGRLAPPTQCPRCDAEVIDGAMDQAGTHYLCGACGANFTERRA